MRTLQLDTKHNVGADLKGRFIDAGYCDHVLRGEAVTVLKPEGEVLCKLLPKAIPWEVTEPAYLLLRSAATQTDNRGSAAGTADASIGVNVRSGGAQYRRVKGDGTLSRTNGGVSAPSGVAGAMDRYPRIPYCRLTSWTAEHYAQWQAAWPFVQAVARVFEAEAPERYAAQASVAAATCSEWIIPGTPFTTITVNRNWQTAVHTDKGDYKPGFGCMTAFRRGKYDGAFLIFPEFRVGVDIEEGDVLLSDVHEYHANSPFLGTPGRYDRVSCVFYYRAKMSKCGTAAQELAHAKRTRRL